MILLGIISDQRALKSKSPAMHRGVLEALGLEGRYEALAVRPEKLGETVRNLRDRGFAGANVTVPYKEAVMTHLDLFSGEAMAIGAVNTIVSRAGCLEGHNTDAAGFLEALKLAGYDPAGGRALVFGAGGAAKAVVFALREAGAAEITVAGRNAERVKRTAAPFGARGLELLKLDKKAVEADLVVNAAAVSSPQESPEMAGFAAGLKLERCSLVLDINYGRKDNFWRELAGRAGAGFTDGLPMLACQARRSFFLWTGLEVETAEFLMRIEAD